MHTRLYYVCMCVVRFKNAKVFAQHGIKFLKIGINGMKYRLWDDIFGNWHVELRIHKVANFNIVRMRIRY